MVKDERVVGRQDWFPADFVRFERAQCEQSIPDRFRAHAVSHAGALAAKLGEQAATYGELDCLAGRIAGAVHARAGGGPEPVVLLCGTRLSHVAAALGVLMAGRPVVPVDPAFPAARIRGILGDSGAPLVLTDDENAALAGRLALPGQSVLNVEATDLPGGPRPARVQVSPGDPAYILYTSGSTGEPKGVVQTHRSLLHVARAYNNELGVSASDRLTCPTSLSYTGTVWVMLAALASGAAFVSCRYQTPRQLAAMMSRDGTTLIHLIASLLRHVVFSLQERLDLPRLRMVYCGGESLYWADVARFRQVFPAHCRLVHLLGSTEAGVVCNFPVPAQDGAGNVVPCGWPIEDKRVLLLGEDGAEVPPGTVGEIAVRSRYVLAGHWGKPDLTRQCLLPDPAGGDARIFRTGDLGRLLPDGCLMHAGRRDFEVKVRGHRMNLREAEEALRSIEDVSAAAVVPRGDGFGDTLLTAYVSLRSGRELSVSELRRRLGELVPEFMVPGVFVFLDALPVSGTGKVDRSALPEPEGVRPALDVPYLAPRSPIERLLARLWSQMLHVEPVGLHDSFFDLGGTSLTAAMLAGRLHADLGVEADLRTFFEAPTVAALAQAVLAELVGRLSQEELDALVRRPAEEPPDP